MWLIGSLSLTPSDAFMGSHTYVHPSRVAHSQELGHPGDPCPLLVTYASGSTMIGSNFVPVASHRVLGFPLQ